jgi:hypothetical protein
MGAAITQCVNLAAAVAEQSDGHVKKGSRNAGAWGNFV